MIKELYHAAKDEYKNSSLCGAKVNNLNSFLAASVYGTNCKKCIGLNNDKEKGAKVKRRYNYR